MRLALAVLASASLLAGASDARSNLSGVGFATAGVGAAETLEFGSGWLQDFHASAELPSDSPPPDAADAPAPYEPLVLQPPTPPADPGVPPGASGSDPTEAPAAMGEAGAPAPSSPPGSDSTGHVGGVGGAEGLGGDSLVGGVGEPFAEEGGLNDEFGTSDRRRERMDRGWVGSRAALE